MDIKEALSDLLYRVTEEDRTALLNYTNSASDAVSSQFYHKARHEMLRWFTHELTKLIKLIPTEQVTYYVLKETDTFEDLLKRSAEHGRRTEKDTNERNYQEQN